jgi:hypothetical protein
MKNKIFKEICHSLIFLCFAILFFYKNISFDNSLVMGDPVFIETMRLRQAILNGNINVWFDNFFFHSYGMQVLLVPSSLLLGIFQPYIFPQVHIIFNMWLLGYFSFLMFRYMKLSYYASYFGAFALMFSNNIVTLVLAGHLGKFETFAYLPLVLLFFLKGMDAVRIRYFLLSGAFLGIAFLGKEVSTGVYFLFFLASYFAYLIYSKKGIMPFQVYLKTNAKAVKRLIIGFVGLFLVTIMFSMQVIVMLRGIAGKEKMQDKLQIPVWEWCTKWSFPPEETIDFIAPGLFGYYTGSQEHPYWGRMGTASYAEHNMKLNGENLGYIVFVFALFAFIMRRRDSVFLAVSGLILLLISFGKYFPPLYWMIYKIPYMDSFRNPNRFLHIFVFVVCVLSATGMDSFLKYLNMGENSSLASLNKKDRKRMHVFKNIVFVIPIVALAVFSILSVMNLDFSSVISAHCAELMPYLDRISQNIKIYFFRFILISALVASITAKLLDQKAKIGLVNKTIPLIVFIILCVFLTAKDLPSFTFFVIGIAASLAYGIIVLSSYEDKSFYRALPVVYIFILLFDLWYTGQFYIQTQSKDEFFKVNQFVAKIKETNTKDRVHFLSCNGVLNILASYSFPYYDIPMVYEPQLRTLQNNISQLFESMAIDDPIQFDPKLYSMTNVRYLISDVPVKSVFDNELKLINTMRLTEAQTGYLYELTTARPGFELVNTVIKTDTYSKALEIIKSEKFNLAVDAVICDEETENIIKNIGSSDINIISGDIFNSSLSLSNNIEARSRWSIQISSELNEKTAVVDVDRNSILIIKDLYLPDWYVYVDDIKQPMLKVDCILQGVYVPAGKHIVKFKYEPSNVFFYITLFSWILLISILLIYCFNVLRKKRTPGSNTGGMN